jgi:hypothetical protein
MPVVPTKPLAIEPSSLGTSSIQFKEFQAEDVLSLSDGGTGVSSLADLSSLLNLSSLVTSGGGVTLVSSVNGLSGTVVLDPDDLDDTATTNKFTTASEISKLATIEASATADQTGAEIKSLYEAEADTNAFTDALLSKLNDIEASATGDLSAGEILSLLLTVDGTGTNLDADKLDGLEASYFTGLIDVNTSAIDANTSSIDTNTSKLDTIEVSATQDQTGAEIKSLYEAEADTNAFTDALLSKLNGIEASSTGDQTGAEIKSLYEAEADTNAFTDAEQTKLGLFDPSANFSKTITIESPTSAEDITFWYTPSAITVVELLAIVQGTSSVTWTMHHDPDRSAAGNKIVTAGTTTDNTTTGESITSFDDGTIPAGSFIWFESSALVGTPDWFSVTMVYRVD